MRFWTMALVVLVGCGKNFIDLPDGGDSDGAGCDLAACVTACIGGGFVGATCVGSTCTCIPAGADADGDAEAEATGADADVDVDADGGDADADADADADVADAADADADADVDADVADDVADAVDVPEGFDHSGCTYWADFEGMAVTPFALDGSGSCRDLATTEFRAHSGERSMYFDGGFCGIYARLYLESSRSYRISMWVVDEALTPTSGLSLPCGALMGDGTVYVYGTATGVTWRPGTWALCEVQVDCYPSYSQWTGYVNGAMTFSGLGGGTCGTGGYYDKVLEMSGAAMFVDDFCVEYLP